MSDRPFPGATLAMQTSAGSPSNHPVVPGHALPSDRSRQADAGVVTLPAAIPLVGKAFMHDD
ncbi:MAG: hypothetical protein HZA59_04545 [Hydrogenophilales bacterium]|nr:hypothetical protein [Hydrogenophilales bacterium]